MFADLIQNQNPQQNQAYQPPQQTGFQPNQQRQQQQSPPYPGVQVQPPVQVHSNPFAGRPGAVPHSPQVPQPSVPVAPPKPIFAGRPEPITPAPPQASWTTPAIVYQPTTPAYVPPTPAPVVTTPAPPVSSTVAGEGLNCYTTQECEVGCCYGPDGQLLDMSTYGPGGPKEYQVTGKCWIRTPGRGDRCDDLCPCSTGYTCDQDYNPIYPGTPQYVPGGKKMFTKPPRECKDSNIVKIKQTVFWECYKDHFCSGFPNV